MKRLKVFFRLKWEEIMELEKGIRCFSKELFKEVLLPVLFGTIILAIVIGGWYGIVSAIQLIFDYSFMKTSLSIVGGALFVVILLWLDSNWKEAGRIVNGERNSK